jgi:hypothetical protein
MAELPKDEPLLSLAFCLNEMKVSDAGNLVKVF